MSVYSNNEAIRSFIDSRRYKYHVDNNGVYTLSMESSARMNASIITLCAAEDHVIAEATCPVVCPVKRLDKLRSFAAYANRGMNCGHFGVEEICEPDSGRVTGGVLKFKIAAESFGENPEPQAVYEAMVLAVITHARYADGATTMMFGAETDPMKCVDDCERCGGQPDEDDEGGYDECEEDDEEDEEDDDGDSEGTDAEPEDESGELSDEDAEDDDMSALRRELQEMFGELIDEDEIDESDMSLNDMRVLEALRKLLACGEEEDEARMAARIHEAVTGLEALLSELSEEEGEKYGDLHESVLELMGAIAEADSDEPDCDEADDADEAEDSAEDSGAPEDEQTKSMFAQLMDMLTELPEAETGVDPLIPVRARMNACFVRQENANEYLFSIHAVRNNLKRLKELETRFDEARSELEETAEEAKACVKRESDADEICAEISGRLRMTTRLLRIIRKYLRGIELRGSEDLWDEDDLPVSAPDGDGESGEDTWDEDDLATSEPDGDGDSCDDAWDED